MTQKEQQATLAAFRAGEFNVMIATCIAEEGLDIPQVGPAAFALSYASRGVQHACPARARRLRVLDFAHDVNLTMRALSHHRMRATQPREVLSAADGGLWSSAGGPRDLLRRLRVARTQHPGESPRGRRKRRPAALLCIVLP